VIVSVQVQTADSDAYETDVQARHLRQELLSLDLDDVTLGREAPAPSSGKGEAIAVGTIIMTMANSAVLVAACQVIRAWVTRGQGRHAIIRYGKGQGQSLEISGATTAQHQKLIDAFLSTMRRDLEEASKEGNSRDAPQAPS
jgi:hypothetical protein